MSIAEPVRAGLRARLTQHGSLTSRGLQTEESINFQGGQLERYVVSRFIHTPCDSLETTVSMCSKDASASAVF
jgi:hypothetical protein